MPKITDLNNSTVKLGDFKFPVFDRSWLIDSTDRERGIRIETDFAGTRYFIIQDTLVILQSWGGCATVDLDNIPEFVDELYDLYDTYANVKKKAV